MERRQPRLKNKKAFTLLEVLVACVICFSLMWSSRHVYRLYHRLVFSYAFDQVLCACHYAALSAQESHKETSFTLIPPASYEVHDGIKTERSTLPGGVVWGVFGEVYGPPSRPVSKVEGCAVGGNASENRYSFTWHESGAQTPGALYFSSVLAGQVAALTLPRASQGVPAAWLLCEGKWIRRGVPGHAA